MHVDPIGKYSKSKRQQKPCDASINNNGSLTCVTVIGPATGWFEIIKLLMYDLDEFMGVNDEYIDKTSTRVRHFFNNIWLKIYPHPKKVVFENGSEYKWYFTPLLKGFDIKLVLTTILKTQSHAPVERVH